jgi:hypothetical protein
VYVLEIQIMTLVMTPEIFTLVTHRKNVMARGGIESTLRGQEINLINI